MEINRNYRLDEHYKTYDAVEWKALRGLRMGIDLSMRKEVCNHIYGAKNCLRGIPITVGFDKRPETYSLIKYATDFALAHFDKIFADGDLASITIAGEDYVVPSDPVEMNFKAYTWNLYMNLSVLNRDVPNIQRLGAYPVWNIVKIDEPFHQLMSEYLYAMLAKNMDEVNRLHYLLLEDLESNIGFYLGYGDEPSYLAPVPGRLESMKPLRGGLVPLMHAVAHGDNEKMNAALEKHLADKHAYLVRSKKEKDQNYMLDYPTLGVLSWAHDHGMQVEVTSNYIPDWLYKGDFDRSKVVF